jgi:hypothetical protein
MSFYLAVILLVVIHCDTWRADFLINFPNPRLVIARTLV